MKIKVQAGLGKGKFCFRALVCGGLLVYTDEPVWNRKVASEMLDLLEIHGFNRKAVRFVH